MQLTQRITIRTERPARGKRRRVVRDAARKASPSPTRDQARVGPPQDRATYNCSCGYIFVSDVTTSVGCPHCGSELAW
jgi:predicted Zn-ribbon and HTH transcriptional regulator